jgi:hypothetical protein
MVGYFTRQSAITEESKLVRVMTSVRFFGALIY